VEHAYELDALHGAFEEEWRAVPLSSTAAWLVWFDKVAQAPPTNALFSVAHSGFSRRPFFFALRAKKR
jgi:hypothetical protein